MATVKRGCQWWDQTPRTRGDRPIYYVKPAGLRKAPPHKWAVGTMFEWQFDFLMPTNPFYEPETKQKAKNTRQPRTARPSKPKITKSPTAQPKQAKPPKVPKRANPTPEEHKQHSRDHTTETAPEARETA